MRTVITTIALALLPALAQAQDIHQLTPAGLCPVTADITIGAVGRYVWTMRQCRPPSDTPQTTRYWWPYYSVVDTWDLPGLAPDVIKAYKAGDRFKTADLMNQAINKPLTAPEFAPALDAAKAAYAAKRIPRSMAPDGSACACDIKQVNTAGGVPTCPTEKAPTGPLVVCRGM